MMTETLQRLGERSACADHRKDSQKIAGDHDFREFGCVKVIFDVVQRDGADKLAVIGYVKVIEAGVDEFFADLGETGCRRDG